MLEIIEKLKRKNFLLKFILSYYGIIFFIFLIWIFFLDDYSYFEHQVLNKKLKELNNNKEYYNKEFEKDSIEYNNLKDPIKKEKFAREKYYMKKDSEDVYIIEYKDSLK